MTTRGARAAVLRRPIFSLPLDQRTLLWLVLVCLAIVAAPHTQAENVDPLEPVNRKVFWINDKADRWLIRPLAKGYDRFVPRPLKLGIHNVLVNLGTPAVALNQFLQGKPRQGVSDTGRFLLNSTIGVLGLFDVASHGGLPRHDEDFGQTFGVWGIGSGPFLMLPARGPSTVTDTVGSVLDFFTNPLNLITPSRDRNIAIGVDALDTRVQLLSVDGLISGDPYLFMRDAFLQRRQFLINDGLIEDDPFLDDFDDDYDDEDY